MTDITELAQSLKAAAEKATQGNWRAFQYHDGRCGIGGGHHDEIMVCEHISKERPHDAMFIALANPANVLALVEALEKAQAENEYIRKRHQQLDLLIGKNILVMQAAIIEWQATGDAKTGWRGFITRSLGLANCLMKRRKTHRPISTANMLRLMKNLWRFTSGFGNKARLNVPPLASRWRLSRWH